VVVRAERKQAVAELLRRDQVRGYGVEVEEGGREGRRGAGGGYAAFGDLVEDAGAWSEVRWRPWNVGVCTVYSPFSWWNRVKNIDLIARVGIGAVYRIRYWNVGEGLHRICEKQLR
jgi:hypothetical protein